MLSLLVLALGSQMALARPDLTVSHVGGQSASLRGLSIPLEVSNIGTSSYVGLVRVKPFLIPEVPVATLNGFKATQLDSELVALQLAPGESRVIQYFSANLPHIPKSKYWLGATAVPVGDVQAERDVKNNVTNQLLPIGQFYHQGPSPLDTDIDIYSDIRTVSPIRGRVSHPWRLSWRGPHDREPSMRVLFFVYDPIRKYVHSSTYEKGVGWVDMGQDYDERGRLVKYDVYNQSPEFHAVAPGDNFLLTLANYTENVFEWSHVNNLDARKFHSSYLTPAPSLEVWKTYVEEDPMALNVLLQLNSLYETRKNWVFQQGTLPEGLELSQTAGETSPSYQVLLSHPHWEIDYGVFAFQGSFEVRDPATSEVIESKPLNLVVSKFRGGEQPVLEVEQNIIVSATSPFAPAPMSFVITNSGLSPLRFNLEANNDWIFFDRSSGSVPAQSSLTVTLSFSPVGRDLGNTIGSFKIYNNSVDSLKTISVIYHDLAPTPFAQ